MAGSRPGRGILAVPMFRPSAPTTDPRTAAPAIAAVCPYLLAEDGAWRASTPAREHRCTAVSPGAILAPDKQRRLCLVEDHQTCSTYQAAVGRGPDVEAVAGGRPAVSVRPGTRSLARTAPLVLDHGRVAVSVPALRGEPRLGQFILIGLMALAFAAILLARLPIGTGTGAGPGSDFVAGGASASPTTEASPVTSQRTAVPSVSESPDRTLVPTEAKPSSTPAATASAGATKTPEAPTTYTVKRGDTLSGIASQFGTTWQVLAELNDIKDPGRLRVGQQLDLP